MFEESQSCGLFGQHHGSLWRREWKEAYNIPLKYRIPPSLFKTMEILGEGVAMLVPLTS